jgi:low affinity Fe/Cu permease
MRTQFDKFADKATNFVAHPAFFIGCVSIICIWLPSFFLIGSLEIWQLLINTFTTCVTFVLVALLQNDTDRFEKATSVKLNAIAEGLGHVMDKEGLDDESQVMYDVMGLEKPEAPPEEVEEKDPTS